MQPGGRESESIVSAVRNRGQRNMASHGGQRSGSEGANSEGATDLKVSRSRDDSDISGVLAAVIMRTMRVEGLLLVLPANGGRLGVSGRGIKKKRKGSRGSIVALAGSRPHPTADRAHKSLETLSQ